MNWSTKTTNNNHNNFLKPNSSSPYKTSSLSPSSQQPHQKHNSPTNNNHTIHHNTSLEESRLPSQSNRKKSGGNLETMMKASSTNNTSNYIPPHNKLFSMLSDFDNDRENELRDMIDLMDDPEIEEFPSIQESKAYSTQKIEPFMMNGNSSGTTTSISDFDSLERIETITPIGKAVFATSPTKQMPNTTNNNNNNHQQPCMIKEHDSEIPSENMIPSHALQICPSMDSERLVQHVSSLNVLYETSLRERKRLTEQDEQHCQTIRDLTRELISAKERIRKNEEFFALNTAWSNNSLEKLRGDYLQQKAQEIENIRNENVVLLEKHSQLAKEKENLQFQKNDKIKSMSNEVERLASLQSQSETLLSSRNLKIKQLEEMISMLRAKYVTKQNENMEFEGISLKSQERIQSLEKLVDTLKRDKVDLEKRARGAVEDLSLIKKEKSLLERNYIELKSSLEDYQDRLKRAEDASQTKIVIDDYSRSITETNQFKLQKMRKQHEEEMTRTCAEYEETIQSLRGLLQEKSHEKKLTFDMGAQAMQMTVDNSAQTSGEMIMTEQQKKDYQKLVDDLKKTSAKCSKLEIENGELRNSIERNRHDYEMEKERIVSDKTLEIETLSSNLGMLEGNHSLNLNQLRRRLDDEERSNSELRACNQELSAQLESKEKEMESMIEEKNKSLLNLRQQMAKDKESVLRSECERIYRDKNKQVDELRERITQLEEKLLKEDIQCKKLEQLNQSFKNRIEELKNDVLDLQQSKEKLGSKANEYDRVFKHCLKYKSNLEKAKREFFYLLEKCEKLEESGKALKAENLELRRRIQGVLD